MMVYAHVEREIQEIVTTTVHLTLTEEEAQALKAVLGRVSGDMKGPRGLISGIHDALTEKGVWHSTDPWFSIRHPSSLHFENGARE